MALVSHDLVSGTEKVLCHHWRPSFLSLPVLGTGAGGGAIRGRAGLQALILNVLDQGRDGGCSGHLHLQWSELSVVSVPLGDTADCG
jgi:hypothetical protein